MTQNQFLPIASQLISTPLNLDPIPTPEEPDPETIPAPQPATEPDAEPDVVPELDPIPAPS